MSSSEALCQLIVRLLEDKKALDIEAIPLKGRSLLTDYFVFASGTSARQVVFLGEHLRENLKKEGFQVKVQGLELGAWVVVDAGAVIVHLFLPENRIFYDLERLWREPLSVKGTPD